MNLRRLLPLVLGGISLMLPALSEGEEIFDWLESLDLGLPKDAPFVRYDTGWLVGVGEDRTAAQDYGFLLESKAGGFRIFQMQLSEQQFSTELTVQQLEQGYLPPSHIEVDLSEFLEKKISEAENDKRRRFQFFFGPSYSHESQLLLYAWIAHRRDLPELSQKLLAKANLSEVKDDFAKVQMWRTILKFGDPSIPF